MELQVEIVSWETMKPATPTPPQLKHYNTYFLKQLTPMVYEHKLDCYAPPNNNNKDHARTISLLKHALSRVLSVFYTFAGRHIVDESTIDCNDAGIPFVEARCDFPLSLFHNAPNRFDMAWRFLPTIIPPFEDRHRQTSISKSRSLLVTEIVPFAVQVSFFQCGGVIMGLKHLNIFDVASAGNFVKTWSDFYFAEAGIDNTIVMNVINKPDSAFAASLCPPCRWGMIILPRAPALICDLEGSKEDGQCITKVFEFDPHSLWNLQAKARSDHVTNPTRVEAVSGFIWKHVMVAAATAGNAIVCGPSVVTHAVNMRPHTCPKVSPKVFGNMVIHGIAYYKGQVIHCDDALAPELADLVAILSRALAEVKDPKFLSKLQGEEGREVIRQYKQKLADLKNGYATTSYKFASCGWIDGWNPHFELGVQVWTGICRGRMSSSFKNLIILAEKPDHGIQASIILDEKEMDSLLSDPDFLAFASPVDSPLHISKM